MLLKILTQNKQLLVVVATMYTFKLKKEQITRPQIELKVCLLFEGKDSLSFEHFHSVPYCRMANVFA